MNAPLPPQYFTLDQANEALKTIRPLVEQILSIRQKVLSKQPEVWPVMEKAAGNGGSRVAAEVEKDYERIRFLAGAVGETGAVLKDINTGLIDFLSVRSGRKVFLCWRYNELEIAYWHDLDADFQGRQPI